MSLESDNKNQSVCDEIKMEQLLNTVKTLLNEIIDFNIIFAEFIDENKKLARDLWNNVTRYNILDGELPCVYPVVTKDEMLEELLVKIQEQTNRIRQSLMTIREKYDQLPKCNELVEQQCDQIDWNPMTNFSIRGTAKHKPPSEYLEDIADILYHYDIAVTCIENYFDSLNIRDNNSYQNLMNSIGISRELSDFVNEFKINATTLVIK